MLRLDVTDRASIAEALASVVEAAGGIFGLVNNAGVGLRGCTEDCGEEEIRELFETNVLGTIAVTQAVIPHMREAGCGRIVTVTSVGGRVCGFGVTMYCATKFAQEGLGEGLAQELAPFGIQSVIIEPGIIETTRWSRHRGTAARRKRPGQPLPRAVLRERGDRRQDRRALTDASGGRRRHDHAGADGEAAAHALRRRSRRFDRDRAAPLHARRACSSGCTSAATSAASNGARRPP